MGNPDTGPWRSKRMDIPERAWGANGFLSSAVEMAEGVAGMTGWQTIQTEVWNDVRRFPNKSI